MATDKQTTANRENARNSTGPKTERGKRRSSRNAFRHGLTAETIIDVLENVADYKALAKAIYADYRPRTNFELQLIARLVSLLWRLRRAIAIESGLIGIQYKSSRKHNANCAQYRNHRLGLFYTLGPNLVPDTLNQSGANPNSLEEHGEDPASRDSKSSIAQSFMRIDGNVFERLGRYEARLWRQAVQIILLLNSVNGHSSENFSTDEKYFRLGSAMAKHRRALWPPFVTFT
ncbi:MAG TPA: hypothetical protein VLU23_04320 [Pseudolabrys sp.]|nr:hypothetical protein [Pseudolabrys sp.]